MDPCETVRREAESESMQIKFQAILTVEAALKAVERVAVALQYVLSLSLFLKIAANLKIPVDAPKAEASP